MRAWVGALLVSLAFQGCVGGDGGSPNPNLAAPKLLVDARAPQNMTVFVHGAFREQVYEYIDVRVENASLVNRTDAWSVEVDVPGHGAFLEVEVLAGDVMYRTRARVDVNATSERLEVARLTPQGWDEPRPYALPYEQILDRVREDA